jgi:hypothetical protein
MKDRLKRLWSLFWGERIRDWDSSEQFWAFFWRDSSYARPGCMIAGGIVIVCIIVGGALLGAMPIGSALVFIFIIGLAAAISVINKC